MAETPPAIKSCATIISENPRWALRNFLAAGALGIGLILAGNWYIERTTPEPPHLISLKVEKGRQGSHMLVARYYSPSAAPCVRSGIHLLYRDVTGSDRDYLLLDATLNGAGLVGSKANFQLWMDIPAGLPTGDWEFIYRMYYDCPPLGFIHHTYTTEPITVTIP